jgi:hypothetical protein
VRIAAIRTGAIFLTFAFLQAPRPHPASASPPFLLTMTSLSAGSSPKASNTAGDSASIIYPDFSAYHRPKPDGCFPSKKSHIEQNFFIQKKNDPSHRLTVTECLTVMLSVLFNIMQTEIIMEAANFRSKRG